MHNNSLSWVILAGGRASRMGGNDKGLLMLRDKTLVETVYSRLSNQIELIRINANRNQSTYSKLAEVHSDQIDGFQGPLAGIHASLNLSDTQWIGFTPCDTPNIPDDLVRRLSANLDSKVDVYVAHDGKHAQPVFSVWNKRALPKLESFLQAGDRKIKLLLDRCNTQYIDFSDKPETFINLNTPEELTQFGNEMQRPTLPLLGFAAYSGTGKTTLLEAILPKIKAHGVRVAVLKHAHHDFDLDTPGKDSYRLRKAGADQMLIASGNRHVLFTETPDKEENFEYLLNMFDHSKLDLILVEGCKTLSFPKIELHRDEVGKPWLYNQDPDIIAIAADVKVDSALPQLDINDIDGISEFVITYVNQFNKG